MGKIWVRDDMQAGGCLHRFQWSRGTPSCTSGGQRKEWEVKEILFHPKYDLNAKKAKGIPEFYDYDMPSSGSRKSSSMRPPSGEPSGF